MKNNKYNFFREDDPIFWSEDRQNPKSIRTENVLPKSTLFSHRLTNIDYLRNLLSQKDAGTVQSVIKIISSASNIKGVKAAVNYIGRFVLKPEDQHKGTTLYDQNGKIIENKEQAGEIIKNWSQDFKEGQNIMSHMLFSVGKTDESNRNKAFLATKIFLEENLKARGFDYFFAPHYDTDNLHFHVIVRKKNRLQKNLRFDKHDLFVMRDLYSKTLSNFGIKRMSLARLDNEEVLDRIEKKIASIKERNSHYQSRLAKESGKDFNAYVFKAKLAATIENVIKEIKSQKSNNPTLGVFDKINLERRLADLKTFKKSIVKGQSKEELKKTIEMTIASFKKDNSALASKMDEMINGNRDIKFAYLKQREVGSYVKGILERQIKEIDSARLQLKEDVKNVNLNEDDKKVINAALVYFDNFRNRARKIEQELTKVGIKLKW